jgi:VanZ family protein
MMWQLFTAQSKYKKRAKYAAVMWTLLIFIACFIPGNEIPNIHVPLADKWVHFILFGGFTFLWLLVSPGIQWKQFIFIGLLGCLFGWMIEEMQGLLTFLGRAKDLYDIYADALGALLGVLLFYICTLLAKARITR